MEKTLLTVDGMSCEHCVNAVTKAVEALSGVSGVAVNLSAKTVVIEHDPILTSVDEIKREIDDLGYDVIASIPSFTTP